MSGDDSLYVRGKAQERRDPDATFMTDGFDRWAESDAPMRVGGSNKAGEDRRSRRRSTKHLHKYTHDQGLCGGARYRPHYAAHVGLRKKKGKKSKKSRSRSSSDMSSGSDMSDMSSDSGSSTDSSMSSSSSSGSDMSSPMSPVVGGRRRRLRRRRSSSSSSDSSSSGSSSDDDSSSTSGDSASSSDSSCSGGRRRRRRRGSAMKCNTVMKTRKGMFGQDEPYPETKCEDDGSSSDSSNSSQSSTSSSGSEEKKVAAGRRRRRRGGISGPEVRAAIDTGFDLFFNQSIWGAKPVDWRIIPDKIKDMFRQAREIWKTLTSYASKLKSAFRTRGAPAVADMMERVGLGKKYRKYGIRSNDIRKVKNQFLNHLLKDEIHKRGGDKFDDKLNSLGIKGAYDAAKGQIPNQYKDKFEKIEKGIRFGYDILKTVKDNADAIISATDAAKPPAEVGNLIKGAVNTVKGIQGLGKKGKRTPSERNMMVSKLMREEGLTLGEASKKVSAMMKKGGAL